MESYQHLFHQEWCSLLDPHVRSLAWILTSPDLLDRASPVWNAQIADLILPQNATLKTWLSELDRDPAPLVESLALHRHRRLGHYAENLLAFYLQHQGMLYAHGLQVHAERQATIGEFDFLLHHDGGLHHWELATKFYLFEPGNDETHAADLFDYLGPNLADTLGAKMNKIFHQQLALSHHPAAQKLLPEPVLSANALIKGWLFYREKNRPANMPEGIADVHCRGYWWTVDEVCQLPVAHFIILERLQWLAPVQTLISGVQRKQQLQESLKLHFQHDRSPVMLAVMQENNGLMQECYRGMVVPDDWLSQARNKRQNVV